MLIELLPKSHNHHRSLPIFDSVLDDFDDWLVAQGYRFSTRQCYILRCTAIERYFRSRRQSNLSALTSENFRKCWQFFCHRPGEISGAVICLQRFLESRQILRASGHPPVTELGAILDSYRQYLREVRGLAAITIEQHCLTSCELARHCLDHNGKFRLADLTPGHIERFICSVSSRFSRGSLQHIVAQVRGLLRFLEMRGEVPSELSSQIDTPRVYRLEQLPRALPWDKVWAFLQAIDRSRPLGCATMRCSCLL